MIEKFQIGALVQGSCHFQQVTPDKVHYNDSEIVDIVTVFFPLIKLCFEKANS